MSLSFAAEAAARWRSLCNSADVYDQRVRQAVASVLRRLAEAPERHRIGAIQFQTTPVTWAQVVEIDDGADWIVIWTSDSERELRVLRIEPAPSM